MKTQHLETQIHLDVDSNIPLREDAEAHEREAIQAEGCRQLAK